jgi:xanthine dehydrogenase YagT iron-sulfur-binding subunit
MTGTFEDVAAQSGSAPTRPMAGVPMRMVVNGTPHTLTLDVRASLLDVLREHLALIGAKKGCEV